MRNLLYLTAAILIILWALGYTFNPGQLIHGLLVVAIIVVLSRLIQERRI